LKTFEVFGFIALASKRGNLHCQRYVIAFKNAITKTHKFALASKQI